MDAQTWLMGFKTLYHGCSNLALGFKTLSQTWLWAQVLAVEHLALDCLMGSTCPIGSTVSWLVSGGSWLVSHGCCRLSHGLNLSPVA